MPDKIKQRQGNDKAKKKLKIGFFCDAYSPLINGVTIAVDTLKEGLEKEGHKVYIVAPKYPKHHDSDKRILRIPSLTLLSKSKYRLALAVNLRLIKLISDMDVVHIHHPGPIGWVASMIARRKNKPYLFTHHTMYSSYWHYFPFSEKNSRKFIDSAVSSFCRRFKFVILPSQSVMQVFRKMDVDVETRIIPTGVDLSRFARTNSGNIRKKYGIGKDEILLIYIGRVAKEKNLDLLFNSFSRIIKENEKMGCRKGKNIMSKNMAHAAEKRKIRLIIVGGGPELETFRDAMFESHLGSHVIFTDFVNPKLVPDYLAAANVFTFPSRSETQGLVSVEAMASGIPVVGLDTTGTRDVVVDGKTGYLTKDSVSQFAGKIQKLIYDDKTRKMMGKNAREEAKRYSTEKITKELLEYYSEIIKYYEENKPRKRLLGWRR